MKLHTFLLCTLNKSEVQLSKFYGERTELTTHETVKDLTGEQLQVVAQFTGKSKDELKAIIAELDKAGELAKKDYSYFSPSFAVLAISARAPLDYVHPSGKKNEHLGCCK